MRTRDAAAAVFYGQQTRDCGCGCGGACLGTAVHVAARDAALKSLRDAGWEESKHTRGAGGQFGSAGSQIKKNASAAAGVSRAMSGSPLAERKEKAAQAHEKAAKLHEKGDPKAPKASDDAHYKHTTHGSTNDPHNIASLEAKDAGTDGPSKEAAEKHRKAAAAIRAS